MEFINPLSGGHAMPMIAAFIQLLPKGFKTQPYRCTDGTIFSVVEGTGTAVPSARERFEFEPRDTFVVPSWIVCHWEYGRKRRSCSRSPISTVRTPWGCGAETRMNALDKRFLSREDNWDLVPHHPQYFARWGEASVSTMTCYLDRAYGEQPGEKNFDTSLPQGRRQLHDVHHGGYWRALDKKDFSFLAPACWRCSGRSWNYVSVPARRHGGNRAADAGVEPWLWQHAEEYGMDQDRPVRWAIPPAATSPPC